MLKINVTLFIIIVEVNMIEDNNQPMDEHISTIISNEIIEKIININNLVYISNSLIKRMEKYPELVKLLLEGNIPNTVLELLNLENLSFLPSSEEDLKFVKYLDLDDKTKKLVSLLNNRVNENLINNKYDGYLFDLTKQFEMIDFQNQIESFIPNIKINLAHELLTKTLSYSSFIVYLPNSKHQFVSHHFDSFVSGKIELNEDIIIEMSYDTFRFLDDEEINKISKCKIVISNENTINQKRNSVIDRINQERLQSKDKNNYKLIKYNHLFFVIENLRLDLNIKNKLIYQLKNMYYDDYLYYDLDLFSIIKPYLNNIDVLELEQLTRDFEQNIDYYKNQEIIKPEFNASYYIDSELPNIENMNLRDIITFINSLSDDLKIQVVREPRILKRLGLPNNVDDNSLNKYVFLLKQRLSTTTMKFINSLDFDIEKFMSNPHNNYYSSLDINHIISRFGVFDSIYEEVLISVADLIGHDCCINDAGGFKGSNILYTFENFFEYNGDRYHTRAIELLNYKSGEELLKELERRNHDTSDMAVQEIEEGKFIVSSNGMHRFTVLRFHYLLDLMKKEKSESELRELYKIPVHLESKVNYLKTYCNYILKMSNQDISYIRFDYKSDNITINYKSGEKSPVINTEQLLNMTIQSVNYLNNISLTQISLYYNRYESFKKFIDNNIPSLAQKLNDNDRELENSMGR